MTENCTHHNQRIIGVVVTHQRCTELRRSLAILTQQSRSLDHLIIIDNAHEAEVQELVESYSSIPMTYIGSDHNLGGAGGFALGMLYALSLGADWVWCADDDGHPDGTEVLKTLLDCASQHKLDQVSPLVCNINDPQQLAFPVRQGLVWRRRRDEIVLDSPEDTLLPRYASLMNGALFSADCLDRIGVPDLRLFFRGDEVELHRRLQRSGLRYGTCLTTFYLHPDGSAEFKPILGGKMYTQYPDSPIKRFFTYRNRGYLMSQPGMKRLLLQEYARFGWFFLIQRHDIKGFIEWLKLHRLGRREHFIRPE